MRNYVVVLSNIIRRNIIKSRRMWFFFFLKQEIQVFLLTLWDLGIWVSIKPLVWLKYLKHVVKIQKRIKFTLRKKHFLNESR